MDRANGNPKELLLQLVQENDLRRTNRFAMTGLGWLARTTLGEGPVLDGLACTPAEGLSVEIAPGAIYKTAPVDAVAYGDLPADPHLILKQGLMQDPLILACPAPVTSGQSIAYLVQAALQEADIQEPDGEGPAETTVRADRCVVSVKAGEPAATGSQITPTPDEGKVGAWVVTVAQGQTVVTDIALYPGAPFLAVKLPQAAPLDSPVFTGDPQAPTPAAGDNDDSIATTAFVQGELLGVGGFFALKSGSITTPPSTPATGDGYLVPQGATGAWEGHEGQIAIWRGDDWRFIAAAEGMTVILADTGLYYRRATTYWRALMADTAEHVAGEADDLFANPAGVKAAQDAYLHGQEAVEPAPDDELLIYDASAQTNRKITLADLITMPEFDTAEVGEIRPFAGQPSDKWAPCNGGVLSQTAYPELFDRIGFLYLDTVLPQNGFEAVGLEVGSSVATYTFGKYWLAVATREYDEPDGKYRHYFYLKKASNFSGPITDAMSGIYLGEGAEQNLSQASFGASHAVIPIGPNFSRTRYLVFNDSMAAVFNLPAATTSNYVARFATDGVTYAFVANGVVYRKDVADFVAGTGSWSSSSIDGKSNDAFGLVYNSTTEKWVCANQTTTIWSAAAPNGPFSAAPPAPGPIRDMLVMDDGSYLLLTSAGLYSSVDLTAWRTLRTGVNLGEYLSPGVQGTALLPAPGYLTTRDIVGAPVTSLNAGPKGASWDGLGFIQSDSNFIRRYSPQFDPTTHFRLPKFSATNGMAPYFIKVK
ncbi:DUF2793 domain-containing protein [Caulobacter sp. NIBR2454]|uniref:DUF2793 domain-containing protein n=1 Tax=Caulobacter sp. NIBR2454 TaxID=3015996 RepID=UPI0022B74F1B|nr:DUF2793 domain-containing protein [Caulobacter sp. NIBR2454]